MREGQRPRRRAMDFGVATMTRGVLGNRQGYLAVAEAAEKMGYGFISANDHIIVPRDIASRYPYSDSGEWAAAHGRRMPGPAGHAGLPGGPHRAPAAAHLGDGGAAASRRADRQDAGHHRRAVRRAADRRLRRRLAEGGVRGGRRAASSPSAAESPTSSSRLSRRCGRRTTRLSPASTSRSITSCSRPSPCRSRTRRSGSAARAPPP